MLLVHKLSDVIESLIKGLIIVIMVVMSLVTIVEVVRRYILGLSFAWSEELVRYLLIWLSFLGGSIAWKQKALVSFSLLQDKLAGKGRSGYVLDLVIHLTCLAFTSYVAYHSWRYAFSTIIVRQISTGLRLSMFYVCIAIPVGFILMSLFSLERILSIIRQFKV